MYKLGVVQVSEDELRNILKIACQDLCFKIKSSKIEHQC